MSLLARDYFEGNPNTARAVSDDLRETLVRDGLDWERFGSCLLDAAALHARGEALARDMDGVTNAYHDGAHARRVRARAVAFARACDYPPRLVALFDLLGPAHDYLHSGRRYRQLGAPDAFPDDSNEEYSARRVDARVAELLTPVDRLFVQGVILATSFAQRDRAALPAGHEHALWRPYRPFRDPERVFVLADVGGFAEPFDVGFRDSLAAHQELSQDGTLPWSDFATHLAHRLEFEAHCRAQLDAIPPGVFRPDFRAELERRSDATIAAIEDLRRGKGAVARFERLHREAGEALAGRRR